MQSWDWQGKSGIGESENLFREHDTGSVVVCPVGTFENSPAIYRWDRFSLLPFLVPEGRLQRPARPISVAFPPQR